MLKLDRITINGTTYELVPEIAPLFNQSNQYSAGDWVIKDAVLYKFITNHAANAAWNINDVEEITIDSEIADATEVDSTLAITGKAADAGATGTALATKAPSATIAPEFSDQSTYTAGSYVLKNGVLYRFTQSHSGAWSDADAEVVTVSNEINSLKTAISNTTGNTIIQFSDPTLKQYINTSGDTVSWDTPSTSVSTNIKWAVVECQPGDKFTINGKGGFSDRLWAFADSSKNILIKSNANVTATNLLITAPNNSAYLIINDEINKQSFVGELLVNAVEDNKKQVMQTYDILYGDINLLEFSTKSKTISGITFNENANGTVTANGTATANSIYEISFTPAITGLYHLSGCPTGGSSTQYYQRIKDIEGKDTGEGVEVTLTAGINYLVWIVIISGRTVENLEFKPTLMLKSKSISSLSNLIATLPFVAQTPPLLEGGIDGSTGRYHHDTNETWVKSRIRTGVVRVAKGAILATSGEYKLTVCRYADYELTNYIETIVDATATKRWACPNDGYYSFTFMLSSGGSLTIDTVKSAWDFSQFYCVPDDRIRIHWIGTGIESESSTYTDSGDCALVVFPDGTGLLIDGANKRNYSSVRKRLAEAGFYRIKNIIISHFHADHIGGIIQMVNSSYIDITGATVYLPDYDATLYAYNNGIMDDATKTLYDEAMTIFSNAGCNLVYPDTDFKPYEIGGAILSFYNTDMSYYEGRSSNYNDWSLCNYIFYGNVNINFTSDLGPIGQSHLGGLVYKSNIYKADHHGWLNQTSIPSAWINNVSPDAVIALDGAVHDQYLGTDTAPLVKWCDKNGVPYYRKYTNGEIVMAVSKDSWSFETKTTRYELPTT